jgi:MazG family protein
MSHAFSRLVELVAALRSPEGCPWDREQTLASLSRFVLEEAYEVVDAIERGDMTGLREEVGDHIFEGVFLAQIARESGAFDVDAALTTVADKLVRRHPHVFQADGRVHDAESRHRAPSADAALARWDAQKAADRAAAGASRSALAGLPSALPALQRAATLGKRAATAGFDWVGPGDVLDKIEEEIAELRQTLAQAPDDQARAEEEMGDLLLALANLARKLDIEPEAALRKANAKFTKRFAEMEARIAASGKRMEEMSAEELDWEWERAK